MKRNGFADKIFFIGLIAVILVLIFGFVNVYADEDNGNNNGNSGNDGDDDSNDRDDGETETDDDANEDDDEDESEEETEEEGNFESRIKFEKRIENGEEIEIKYEERVFFVSAGSISRLRIEYREKDGKIEKKIKIEGQEIEVEIEDELEIVEGESDDVIEVRLSDGVEKEIKVMPETASARALEAIQKNACPPESCRIILKEVGDDKTEKRIVYEMNQENEVRVLGLFKANLKSIAQIDAEQNGEIISVERPWWAFLAIGD